MTFSTNNNQPPPGTLTRPMAEAKDVQTARQVNRQTADNSFATRIKEGVGVVGGTLVSGVATVASALKMDGVSSTLGQMKSQTFDQMAQTSSRQNMNGGVSGMSEASTFASAQPAMGSSNNPQFGAGAAATNPGLGRSSAKAEVLGAGASALPGPGAGTGISVGAGGVGSGDPLANVAGQGGGSQAQLFQATKDMQEMQMSFNLQYLNLQNQMQNENRQFTMVSNIMKTKHDTVKNSISNIR